MISLLDPEYERAATALLRELRRDPDAVITYEENSFGGIREDETVRELAESHLTRLESEGPNCIPELQRKLRAELD